MCCSLGRARHRTASPFPAGWERRRGAGSEVLATLGRHASFPRERSCGSLVKGRARRVHAGVSERAGYVIRKATKPPLPHIRTLRNLSTRPLQDVIACGGGPKSRDANNPNGPAKSELTPAWARLARSFTNEAHPHLRRRVGELRNPIGDIKPRRLGRHELMRHRMNLGFGVEGPHWHHHPAARG